MRRALPYLLALMLGAGAAVLAACADGPNGGIPASDASELERQIEDVRQAVAAGRCDNLSGQLRQVVQRIDNLPSSVDQRLRERMLEGRDRLSSVAFKDCNRNRDAKTNTTTTETTTTETTTTETNTTPTQTQPTTTPTTPTTPATTPTTPAPPAPPPEPAVPPPPAGQGGGTPPGVIP